MSLTTPSLLSSTCFGSTWRDASEPDTTDATTESTAAPSLTEEFPHETELLAPPVSTPLDATDIEPCDLISDQAVSALRYDAGSARMATAEACNWDSTEHDGARASLRANTEDGGLSWIYQIRDTYAVFDEMTVGNYPAVHAHTIEDESRCVLYTGIADDQYLATDFIRNTLDSFDSCQAAIEFTEAVIAELPAAS
ncbi:DUF3558 domain-containing protein [Actinoalloteichus caeruleus]|uniref:DUF3558 domain-containing protein n=1 Tax=Actinoalloteichus cyanogriseus TaxID=2893586 RepID=UPI0009DEA6ED|nr:DUF3558 domain-containing protein [Actinoalloteichus caeruleus]